MPSSFAQEAPPPPADLSGTTYWKIVDYDVVVKTAPCPEKGFCLSIYDINPANHRAKELMAEMKNVREETDSFGMQGRLAPERISSSEILAHCGYQIKYHLEQDSDSVWSGTVVNPFNNQNLGFNATLQKDDTVKLSGYLPWIPALTRSFKAKRIDPPPSGCSIRPALPAPPPAH